MRRHPLSHPRRRAAVRSCGTLTVPLALPVLVLLLAGPVHGQTPEAPARESCTGFRPPATADFGAPGPFGSTTVRRTGPDGRYTLFLPEPIGADGFLHPIASWGNGTSTAPIDYTGLLSTLASHGFVVIASDSPRVTATLMRRGIDWLLAEHEGSGAMAGALAPACAVTLGHSLGGGAALGAGSHPSVVATVSLHGVEGSLRSLQGALLLLTSTDDGSVPRDRVTLPLFEASERVPTALATLSRPEFEPSFQGHLVPMGSAGPERAPTVAWLRYWVYGDPDAAAHFFGPECVLCREPWTPLLRRNGPWETSGDAGLPEAEPRP